MKKILLSVGAFFFLCGTALAAGVCQSGTLTTTFNPFTGKPDYVCTGFTGGGSGSSTPLVVGTGTASNFTTNVTSPTFGISFLGSQFISAASGTTNFISINPSILGPTIYSATSTASFPFGFSASTGVFSSTITANGRIALPNFSIGPNTIGGIYSQANPQIGINLSNASSIQFWEQQSGINYTPFVITQTEMDIATHTVIQTGADLAFEDANSASISQLLYSSLLPGILVTTNTRVNGDLTVSNLTSGQCVQTTTGGKLTVTGSGCSSGSGSGTVSSGTQYQLAYYAVSGTTVSGNTAITTDVSNNLLTGPIFATASGTPLNGSQSTQNGVTEILNNTAASSNGSILGLKANGTFHSSVGSDSCYRGTTTDKGLSFSQFNTDPMRWYTNSGATPVMTLNSSGQLLVSGPAVSTSPAILQLTGFGSAAPATSGAAQSAGLISRQTGNNAQSLETGNDSTNSAMWLQAVLYNSLSTNLNLELNPNGGTVIHGGAATFNGNISFKTTSSQGVVGTTTNDNAGAGNVGESTRSYVSSPVSFGLTTVWGDLTSISLTAGDWLVSAQGTITDSSSVATELDIGISLSSGNSAVGLNFGDNRVIYAGSIPATGEVSPSIADYRISVASLTPVYYKYMAVYTGTAPVLAGRISAVRIR